MSDFKNYVRQCKHDHDDLGTCALCRRECQSRDFSDSGGGRWHRLCRGCIGLVQSVPLPLAESIDAVRESIAGILDAHATAMVDTMPVDPPARAPRRPS